MLNVDIFFYEALKANDDLMELTEGRIFNTARTTEDEDEDKIPYCIIAYEGGRASEGSKDGIFNPMDSATVSIMACAGSRDDLATLTELVAQAVGDAFDDPNFYESHDNWNFYIEGCSASTDSVQYDPLKPCHYQTLTFQCETSKR